MLGTTLGRYRILDQLGEGGMGRVYRALDERLEREVALKVLRSELLRDESARRRFRQEARALSRLNHPGIATLFDFDTQESTDFLVLEFVPGQTLAALLAGGPLPESRARAIALEVGEGLEAAHEQGIVHRDLKPGNIIITPRGRAKVLDFGLARLTPAATPASLDVTRSMAVVGTLPYMAPEQVAGGPVDPRTDLYALGAVLYEMLAGRRAFGEASLAALVYDIVHRDAPPLRELRSGVSEELARLAERCLEKDPGRRFPDAAALVRALRAVRHEDTAGPAAVVAEERGGRIRSLAVLPLENRSGDPSQEFFVDGMTDALIADLAQIRALRVISRTSAMHYKGVRKSLPDIARELRVDAIIEGSALRAGDRVRITAQLIEAATDRSLWARSYDRDLTDVISLQNEVARAIAEEIKIQVTPEERSRLARVTPINPRAHVAYLKGRFLWNRWDTESFLQSLVLYQEALAADPDYALAFAGLADTYAVLANTNVMPPGDAYPRAREAALKGLALDGTRAELHASLAAVMRFHDWDWPGAERGFLRAIELNPGYAFAHSRYGNFLSGIGRHEEAIAECEQALELDPLSLIIHTAIGDTLFYARDYERAVGYYRKCLEMDSTFGPGHTDLARALEHLGRYDEAFEEFLGAQPTQEGRPVPSTGLAIYHARAGRRSEAKAVIEAVLSLAERQFVSPFGIASYFAVIGQSERGLEWLERAYAQRDGTLVWIKVHPRLDGLRGEPRFRALLEKMRLYP